MNLEASFLAKTPSKTPSKVNSSFLESYQGSIGAASTCTSMELLQAKVEHLEKERLELSFHLHNRSERERSYKIKLEQLENNIKAGEEAKKKLAIEITKLTSENHILRSEKSELQTEVGKLAKEIQSATRDMLNEKTTLSLELKRLEKELVTNNLEKRNLENEITKSHTRLQEISVQQKEKSQEYERLLSSLTEEKQSLLLQVNELRERNHQLVDQIEDLTATLSEKDEVITQQSRLVEEIANLKALLHEKDETIIALQSLTAERPPSESHQVSSNQTEMLVLQQEISELKEKLFQNERKRKDLHNQLQAFKGNIRVLVRCRPYLSSDHEEEAEQQFLLFHEDKTTLSVMTGSSRQASQQYSFDTVFQPKASQEDIYREVTDLVQSVIDGYRVCIFSYGQTGSGKTFTMTGEKQGSNRGIIPRAFEELVLQSKQLRSTGWETTIQMSIVELYNEEFRDLLLSNKDKEREKIKLSYQNHRTHISGVTTKMIDLEDEERALSQFLDFLEMSNQARTTASTNMNEYSSRSHLIVLIDFIGKHHLLTSPATATACSLDSHGNSNSNTTTSNRRQSALPGASVQSQTVILGGLKLCDLAGSERLDRTQTLNDSTRLKETVNINKSLSSLSDVFLAIHNKQAHIPFRNSKLTLLLQDCLSGDGKSLMFVNISPTQASLNETLCSLRFANQVSQVELGKVQKHVFTATTATAVSNPPLATNLLLPPPPPSTNTTTNTTGTASITHEGLPPPAISNTSSTSKVSNSNNSGNSSNHRNTNNSNHSHSTPLGGGNRSTTLTVHSSDIVTNRPFTRRSSLSSSSSSSSSSFRLPPETENLPENLLSSNSNNEEDLRKPPSSSSHSIPSIAINSSQSSTSLSMNEKLQHYLSLKQRNLGTSQRRGSVLPSHPSHHSSSLGNPSRPTTSTASFLVPASHLSQASMGLDTSMSFLGKRDLPDRSFVIDSTSCSSWTSKKPKTSASSSSDHSTRKNSWR